MRKSNVFSLSGSLLRARFVSGVWIEQDDHGISLAAFIASIDKRMGKGLEYDGKGEP